MNKKLYAFTLNELVITLVIVGFLMVSVFTTLFDRNSIHNKKLIALSHSFYEQITGSITSIVYNKTSGKGIQSLTSTQLAEHLLLMLADLKPEAVSGNYSCEKFVAPTPPAGEGEGEEEEPTTFVLTETAKCFETNNGLLVAVDVDSTCSQKVFANEYYSEDLETREVNNACGYVAYEDRKSSTGTLGEDLFVIPLGSMRVR
ncbi:hypothetical protein IJ670_05880 [bacterium]|nr:hypothetical protein [bacterium]